MKWQKPSQAIIDLFQSVMPGLTAVERKMFGYPAGFVNGNLFMGLFQESMILRLPERAREDFLKLHETKLFEPMPGRPMREYVAAPQSLMLDKKELTKWVARAFEYRSSLKPKTKTANSSKRSTKLKKAKRR